MDYIMYEMDPRRGIPIHSLELAGFPHAGRPTVPSTNEIMPMNLCTPAPRKRASLREPGHSALRERALALPGLALAVVGVVEWEGPSRITPRPAPPPGPEDLRRQRALASRVSTGASARGPGFPGAEMPVTAAPACVGRAGRLDPAGMTSAPAFVEPAWEGRGNRRNESDTVRCAWYLPGRGLSAGLRPALSAIKVPTSQMRKLRSAGPHLRLVCLGHRPWLSSE